MIFMDALLSFPAIFCLFTCQTYLIKAENGEQKTEKHHDCARKSLSSECFLSISVSCVPSKLQNSWRNQRKVKRHTVRLPFLEREPTLPTTTKQTNTHHNGDNRKHSPGVLVRSASPKNDPCDGGSSTAGKCDSSSPHGTNLIKRNIQIQCFPAPWDSSSPDGGSSSTRHRSTRNRSTFPTTSAVS